MLYLAEFKQTLFNTDGDDWPEHIKKAFLNNKILNNLYKAIVTLLLSESYQEYCLILQTISHNLKALQNQKRKNVGQMLLTACTTLLRLVTELSEKRINQEPTHTAQVAATQQRACQIAPEVLEKYKKKRTCLRCGSSHFIQDCLLLFVRRPTPEGSLLRTSVAAVAAKETDRDGSDDNDTDTGKAQLLTEVVIKSKTKNY